MVKSFAELEEQETPSQQDVIDTMEDYAKLPSSISSSVVIDVINRAGLSRDALEACLSSAIKGEELQTKMAKIHGRREARQYGKVADHIRRLLHAV